MHYNRDYIFYMVLRSYVVERNLLQHGHALNLKSYAKVIYYGCFVHIPESIDASLIFFLTGNVCGMSRFFFFSFFFVSSVQTKATSTQTNSA